MTRRRPTRITKRRLALLVALMLLTFGLIATLHGRAPAAQEDPDDFIPTEQIRADSAVSFPVDI